MERLQYNSSFNSWIDKKRDSINSKYFPEAKSSGGIKKVELYLSSYATKANLKNATCVNTSDFAKKSKIFFFRDI